VEESPTSSAKKALKVNYRCFTEENLVGKCTFGLFYDHYINKSRIGLLKVENSLDNANNILTAYGIMRKYHHNLPILRAHELVVF
jgi:hypothetical protein